VQVLGHEVGDLRTPVTVEDWFKNVHFVKKNLCFLYTQTTHMKSIIHNRVARFFFE
jgi:hypothetical protein